MSERRTTVYLVSLALLFFLLILAAFLVRSYLDSAVSKGSWTNHNERMLAGLPVYPGSIEAHEPSTTGERDPNVTTRNADGGPYRGYWTTHTYTLPLNARPDLVLDYYAQNIGNWSIEPGQTACEARYRRGRAILDLKVCDGSLVLSLNYRELD